MSRLNAMELRTYQKESSQHSHDYAQLVLPIKGTLELDVGHHSGRVNENTAAFIDSGEKHCFAASTNNLFVVVDLFIVPKQLFNTPFFALTPASKQLVSFTQSYLEQGVADQSTQNLISDLLIKTLTQTNNLLLDASVLKAKNWLDKNFSRPIDINYLAKQCYLSTSQLQRRFKKAMGCTLAYYWRNKKMEQAKFLLSTSCLPIETIAFSLGYEHLSTFTRFFTQQYDQSPSQWRAN